MGLAAASYFIKTSAPHFWIFWQSAPTEVVQLFSSIFLLVSFSFSLQSSSPSYGVAQVSLFLPLPYALTPLPYPYSTSYCILPIQSFFAVSSFSRAIGSFSSFYLPTLIRYTFLIFFINFCARQASYPFFFFFSPKRQLANLICPRQPARSESTGEPLRGLDDEGFVVAVTSRRSFPASHSSLALEE